MTVGSDALMGVSSFTITGGAILGVYTFINAIRNTGMDDAMAIICALALIKLGIENKNTYVQAGGTFLALGSLIKAVPSTGYEIAIYALAMSILGGSLFYVASRYDFRVKVLS